MPPSTAPMVPNIAPKIPPATPKPTPNKAIQKGIIGKDDILSDKELLNLIFLPGFSTAEQVSEISGRGVGMDVVKRKITDIRGQIKINSTINAGTTITIKLPITISIIDGLLVKINNDDFGTIKLSAGIRLGCAQ